MNPFSLHDQVALVTGASRGLGRAMAASLAQAGAHVAVNARDATAVESVAQSLRNAGGSAEALAFDVADEGAQTAALRDLAARHGRLDLVVANAGVQHRRALIADKVAARSARARLVAKAVNWRFTLPITERADAPAARRPTR
ncbi:MAG: SDR family NAD(P)-dependent oxidoreductase [Burkholderiales bacterium]|nr:SDR family NAD(P)-dependent oxidoreductase [Burkholderiales bacterium]